MTTERQKQYLQAMGIDLWVENAASATQVAQAAWQQLAQNVAACRACELCQTRKQTVFGVGDSKARLMLVGEAPGAEEDRRGEPFVGRAGQLLDRMLFAIGLDRTQIYIANILKCRPPHNRDPTPDEVQKCTPFLKQQLNLLQPALIVALGRVSAHHLLNTEAKISEMRHQWYTYGEHKIPLRVTYHPAYLLRNPIDKRKAWEDLRIIRDFLQKAPAHATL